MNFREQIQQIFKVEKIELTDKKISQFEKYFNLLLEWNNKFNLTTITDQEQVIKKHFLDSCLGKNFILPNSKILDIGAGAGFPSIPLKILYPDIRLVLIDSVNKKVEFLQYLISYLDLENCVALHTRAEDLAKKTEYRENFDFVVSRAVASLDTLLEYSLPFLKIGGKFVAYKALDYEQEINKASNALKILGGQVEKIEQKNLFENTRTIICFNKVFATPKKYPRDKNKPRINPL